MTRLTPLTGNTTAETAFLVNDYPYGFRLRCKIRYWLEFKAGKGFRLCSQTTNPKVAGEVWNAPKKSTFSMLAIMGLDDEQHVTWTGCSIYEFDRLQEFESVYGAWFDDNQRATYTAALKAYERYQARKAAQALRNLPVRACSIVNREHPEWGTFGVMEDRGDYYEIHGTGGGRVLSKDEAAQFWMLA